jgi:hypothetical protein
MKTKQVSRLAVIALLLQDTTKAIKSLALPIESIESNSTVAIDDDFGNSNFDFSNFADSAENFLSSKKGGSQGRRCRRCNNYKRQKRCYKKACSSSSEESCEEKPAANHFYKFLNKKFKKSNWNKSSCSEKDESTSESDSSSSSSSSCTSSSTD